MPKSTSELRFYINMMRPYQWVKNILVFLPLLAAQKFDLITFMISFKSFIAFCFAASSVYILNDIADRNADRLHPRKQFRAIVAGYVSLRSALLVATILLGVSLLIASQIGQAFALTIITYFVTASLYTHFIKRLMIVDIFVLALLYSLRIVAGGVATDTDLSNWLLFFTGLFFFSLAAMKREAELRDSIDRGIDRPHHRGYNAKLIPLVAAIARTSGYLSIAVLAFYLSSDTVLTNYARPYFLWIVCPILLYWVIHHHKLTQGGKMTDDPIVFAIYDTTSWVCAALVTCAYLGALLG